LGETISASYLQNLYIPSKLTGYLHPVTLGGMFSQHAGLAGQPPRSDLTVGGSWVLSKRSVLMAKASTQGNVNVLAGIQLGSVPKFTIATNVGYSFVSSKFSIGFSAVLED